MADETKRIIDQDNDQTLSAGDYVMVDSQAEGTRKFDLGTELSGIKADLAEIEGGGVPTTVRQAIKTLFESGAYADTGLTDEMAVITSWASAVTAITLNQSSISISGATTSQLTATTTPSGGTVTWSSSDTSVATVSSSGLVTGVSNGTATITATSGDVSATCSVTVSGIATLSSISASYTQTGTIYDTDDLDDILTAGSLVVTATYSDSSTATVVSTDYTLSGTLTVGTSTITVSYGGKTTTFTVTVTHNDSTIYNWDFTESLIDSKQSATAILSGSNVTQSSTGVVFTGASSAINLGAILGLNRTYEIDINNTDLKVSNQHTRFIMYGTAADTSTGMLIWQKTGAWRAYSSGSWSSGSYSLTGIGAFSEVNTIKMQIDSTGKVTLFVDDVSVGTDSHTFSFSASDNLYIGNTGNVTAGGNLYNITVTGVRVYEGLV